MIDARLTGTDYALRAYGLVIFSLGRVLLSALPWLLPIMALQLWPIFGPGGLAYSGALEKMAEAARAEMNTPGAYWRALLYALAGAAFQFAMLSGFAVQRHRDVLRSVVPLRRGLAAALLPFSVFWIALLLVFQVLPMLGIWVISQVIGPQYAAGWPFFIGILAAVLGIAALALRVSLVFPAIAIGDRSMSIARSYALTGPNVVRMLISCILIGIPFVLASVALSMWAVVAMMPANSAAPPSEFPWAWMAGFMSLGWVLYFLATAVFVTYISLVYAHLCADEVPTPPNWG